MVVVGHVCPALISSWTGVFDGLFERDLDPSSSGLLVYAVTQPSTDRGMVGHCAPIVDPGHMGGGILHVSV